MASPDHTAMASASSSDPALSGSVSAADPTQPLLNFSPGPAPLPIAVLRQVQAELLNFQGTGTSIMCISHRSPEFGRVYAETVAALRRVLMIPAEFEVLFTHGGGHGQFAAAPLNLCAGGKAEVGEYLMTGTWAKRAADEGAKYVTVRSFGEAARCDRLPAGAKSVALRNSNFPLLLFC